MEEILNIEHIGKGHIDAIYANNLLKGAPTENRLLVVTPIEAETASGIIIPGSKDKDVIPRKGRILQLGPISEEYVRTYGEQLQIGDFVYYGLYAGKEIEMEYLGINPKKFVVTILSLTEVLYVEKSITSKY